MASLVRAIAESDASWARLLRRVRRGVLGIHLPIPTPLARLLVSAFVIVREGYYFLARVVVCEPLLKGYLTECGRRLRTGVFVHFVQGRGTFIVGDDVTIDGKCSFSFAARFSDAPTLRIGNRSGIGHACSFTVGKLIEIGDDCRIAGGVWMFDSPGHPSDPTLRRAGAPPDPDSVKPILIHENVWIGGNSIIYPGVTIGKGAVVAAGSVVVSDVPDFVVVAGNPARRIAVLAGDRTRDTSDGHSYAPAPQGGGRS